MRDIIALIEELHARSDLPIAIKGRWDWGTWIMDRSDKELEPLISFVTFYISDPLYTNTLVTVATLILGWGVGMGWWIDLYADQVGKSSLIDSQLLKLKQCLDTEIEMQQNVFSVMGMLDSIVANSENWIVLLCCCVCWERVERMLIWRCVKEETEVPWCNG